MPAMARVVSGSKRAPIGKLVSVADPAARFGPVIGNGPVPVVHLLLGVKVVCGPDRCEIPFKLRGGTPLRNLKQILGARRDLPLHAFRLFYQGDEVRDTDTATALGMQDGAVIHIAHIHRTRERGRTRKCEECCARSVQKLIDDVVGGRP